LPVSLLTLLLIFAAALIFSTILTYVARWLGVRLGALDVPMERKVHTKPIPRIGGLAVFVSFVATIAIMNAFSTQVSEFFSFDQRTALGFYGALVVFGCGLWDDFRRLNPWIKLLFQIAGVSLAFAGGISIGGIFFDGHGIQFGILSYAVTVFWFLLFINAVNLIDGRDGLAGGVVFFTCLLMIILSVMTGSSQNALYFTALGGAVLGFLRFNFNPASIFLGDGGSYFLGYVIAALAIKGSVKSQVGALMLIPLLALGVPMFDTILAPLRRWIKGRRIFQPDRGHIHHRLLAMGLSSQKAVLVIYGLTLVLCLLAILIATNHNELVGIVLILLLVGVLTFVRKNGYLEYLAFDKFYGWFKDMTDVAGFSRERRTFLALQMDANKARTLQELMTIMGSILEMLQIERTELHMKINRDSASLSKGCTFSADCYTGPERRKNGKIGDNAPLRPFDEPGPGTAKGDKEGGNGSRPPASASTKLFEDIIDRGDETVWIWTQGHYRRQTDTQKEEMMKIDLPLHEDGIKARIILMKDLGCDPLHYYTIRRLEHLRRTLRYNLIRVQK
jgi:UDP-GlcNAc:undecaprenyl-phosphate/decaprenyl-phosphate GlcNAc-1-phosphate transferase